MRRNLPASRPDDGCGRSRGRAERRRRQGAETAWRSLVRVVVGVPSVVAGPALAQMPAGPSEAPATPPLLGSAVEHRTVLPHDLSPWSMFLNADLVVQSILIGLALASLLTWTIWLAKSIELTVQRRRLRASHATLLACRTLDEAGSAMRGTRSCAADFTHAALQEIERSGSGLAKDGISDRIALSLQRIEAAHGRRMLLGTGLLATIGSTGPFVGLFGTVWGIMNSFIGISRQQTTNLAVVAPGIAEALLATAVGLAAAIPAVVIYNMFARSIAGYRALMTDASAEVLRLCSRDLDRRAAETTQDSAGRLLAGGER